MKVKVLVWKDVTTERGKSGQAWRFKIGDLTISLHHHIHYPPQMWFVSCYALGIEKKEVGEIDVEEAKDKAVRIVAARLKKLSDDIAKIT